MSVATRNPGCMQGLTDCPGKIRQCLNIFEHKLDPVIFDEKEPIPSPCDVAVYHTVRWNCDCDAGSRAIARDVLYRHFSTFVQGCCDHAHRCLDTMFSHSKAVPVEIP